MFIAVDGALAGIVAGRKNPIEGQHRPRAHQGTAMPKGGCGVIMATRRQRAHGAGVRGQARYTTRCAGVSLPEDKKTLIDTFTS